MAGRIFFQKNPIGTSTRLLGMFLKKNIHWVPVLGWSELFLKNRSNTSTIWYVQKLIPAQHWFTAVRNRDLIEWKHCLHPCTPWICLPLTEGQPKWAIQSGPSMDSFHQRKQTACSCKPLCESCCWEGKYSSRRGCRLRRRKFASNPELDLEVENSGKRDIWAPEDESVVLSSQKKEERSSIRSWRLQTTRSLLYMFWGWWLWRAGGVFRNLLLFHM